MKLNKHTTIGFIYKGIYNNIKCIYSHLYYDLIPLYVSDGVKGIKIIRCIDSSVVIVVEKGMYHRCNGKIPDILIMHNLLLVHFNNNLNGANLADIYCTKWFGLEPTLMLLENIQCSEDRIKKLKIYISNYDDNMVPDILDVLKNIKSVEVI